MVRPKHERKYDRQKRNSKVLLGGYYASIRKYQELYKLVSIHQEEYVTALWKQFGRECYTKRFHKDLYNPDTMAAYNQFQQTQRDYRQSYVDMNKYWDDKPI